VLVRTVEMGVLGLIAFLMLGLTVVVAARQTIGSRHPVLAPPALAGAAAAMVFVVVAALFDTMSFPQDPYIFLCFAALVAVVLKPPDE
jgi:O-antigen ligase